MPDIRIRPATAEDLEPIVAVFRQCWTISYAEVLEPAVVATMTEESSHALWARILDETGFEGMLVATVAGEVRGVTRFTIEDGGDGYVASLYVSPAAQGLGLGRMLLATAESELESRGARSAALWVFADNAPSIAFYARCGWKPDGGARQQPQFGAREIRLTKVLGRP